MGKCKIIEKCPCRKQHAGGLSEKLAKPRPAERVIERQIVELARRCETGDCQKEAADAG